MISSIFYYTVYKKKNFYRPDKKLLCVENLSTLTYKLDFFSKCLFLITPHKA